MERGKGDYRDCANSRGTLVSNNCAKVYTSLLQDATREAYQVTLPETQCGAVKGRSTSHVMHLSRTCLDLMRARS